MEGDPEQQMRERNVRRRALVMSICVAKRRSLAVIVLVPLLGKPARIALANVTPLPPYYSQPCSGIAPVRAAANAMLARAPQDFAQPTSDSPSISSTHDRRETLATAMTCRFADGIEDPMCPGAIPTCQLANSSRPPPRRSPRLRTSYM